MKGARPRRDSSGKGDASGERSLCTRCLATFDASALESRGSERLCAACADLAPAAPAAPLLGNVAPGGPRDPSSCYEQPGMWRSLRADMAHWCEGRWPWVRLPLLVYFAYILVRHWSDPGGYCSLFDSLNFGIHELGHAIFRPFGRFLHIAGGTIAQCAAPILSVGMFYKQRDYFAIAACGAWLATNLWDVAVYVGDARAQQLHLAIPGLGLIPPGEGADMHDWRNLLGDYGLLEWDTTFSWLLRGLASATMIASLAVGVWLLYRMARSKEDLPMRPVDRR